MGKGIHKLAPVIASCVAFLVLGMLQASAEGQGHMTLLAVSETDNGYVGGTADLYLTIKPGTGRIFLETFPFTKVDTQMSTRFANEIACDYLDVDCSRYDFFYTLTAKSSIIAGPSAGAAIAALTVAMLEGSEVDEGVALTGTINSGGLIGPVGGLREKVIAGSRAGLKTLLIPKGESFFSNESERAAIENATKGKVDIVEIYTLDEAMERFTGKKRERKSAIPISEEYLSTMKVLARELCGRTKELGESALPGSVSSADRGNNSGEGGINAGEVLSSAKNLSGKGEAALGQERYYSSASYCFGANVEYTLLSLLGKNLSSGERATMAENISNALDAFEAKVRKEPIRTITDLESYMVAEERMGEARLYLKRARNETDAEDQLYGMAWATERLSSAGSWFQFFGKQGREYDFDKDTLATGCTLKLAETEERIQYLELFLPVPLETARREYREAQEEAGKENYEMCLYKASKAKASAGVVLGVLGVDRGNFQEVLDVKLGIVRQMIAEEASQGVFPILGYSYYEYADSLKQDDVLSALLYAEYALELGNLDLYVKQPGARGEMRNAPVDWKLLLVFLIGIAVGGGSALTIWERRATAGRLGKG